MTTHDIPKIGKDELIDAMSGIIQQYGGMKLTVRQIYYRLVAAQLIPNSISGYQRIVKALGMARKAGAISYDAIEDRTRRVRMPLSESLESPEDYFNQFYDALGSLDRYYSIPKWYGQKNIVQVWVEKEALSSLFTEVTDKMGVDLVVCRGYPSLTLLHQASERLHDGFSDYTEDPELHIIYFGDFDPSGADIQRHIDETLATEFGVTLSLTRVAITHDQITEYDIPPAPAKKSDSRHRAFVEREGVDWQVELDAIEPRVLQGMIRESISAFFDDAIGKERNEELKRRKELMSDWVSRCLNPDFTPPGSEDEEDDEDEGDGE